MFYFKKVNIPEYTQNEVESCLRKVSLKRTTPLDIDFTSINIGTDKFFLAREEKSGLAFTRIKTSFEKFLPKLVSKLGLEPNEANYKIRLSILSTIIFIGFTLLWLLSLAITVFGVNPFENFLTVSVIYIVYIVLLLLEYKFTTSKINKAIKKYIS